MSTLPPVADPTASMPPRPVAAPAPAAASSRPSNSVAPAPSRATVLPAGRVGGQSSTTTKSSKSKKKSTVTMATAATASSGGQSGSNGENTGRWTAEEHNLFLQGLELHGKGWKKIAGLIKSRTVVQIRTHAQKYFQKLAKAKQNGEDVTMAGGGASNGGAVAGSNMTMMMGEGRSALSGGGAVSNAGSAMSSSAAAGGGHSHSKRRKQTSGTKRKAIQSVVASARRQNKKKAANSRTQNSNGRSTAVANPTVAPALAPYVLPTPLSAMAPLQAGSAGGKVNEPYAALEDSLFRYLSPAPVLPTETQVNPVARQAGANPITLPSDQPTTLAGGEISPTGVSDLELYPTFTDYSKDTPSWYSKGSDVDALLDVADTLDWLTDTGDLTETYEEAERMNIAAADTPAPTSTVPAGDFYSSSNNTTSMSMNTLPRIDSGAEVNVPPLPSLFDGVTDSSDDPTGGKSKLSLHMSSVPSVSNLDEHLFSSPIEEHDFVSSMLDESGAGSSATLAALGGTP